MRDANAVREERRSTAKDIKFVALGGIALTLCLAALAIWFTQTSRDGEPSIASVSFSTQSD